MKKNKINSLMCILWVALFFSCQTEDQVLQNMAESDFLDENLVSSNAFDEDVLKVFRYFNDNSDVHNFELQKQFELLKDYFEQNNIPYNFRDFNLNSLGTGEELKLGGNAVLTNEIDFIDNIIESSQNVEEALILLNEYSSKLSNNQINLNSDEKNMVLFHLEATKFLFFSDPGKTYINKMRDAQYPSGEIENSRLIIVGGQNFINFAWFVYYTAKCVKGDFIACYRAAYYFQKIIDTGGFVDPCQNSTNPCCGVSCVPSHYCNQNGNCVPLPDFQGCPNVPCPPDHLCRSSDGTCIPI